MADDKEVEKTIAEDLVVTKYKLAGQIVNRVLEQVIAKCVPDASAREICEFGDKLILDETSKVFKKEKDSKKGIAFSTCVSVNNCICHFSPIPSETDYVLKAGDLAKIDLGAHIDGFIAVVAHTVFVGDGEVTGRAADVLLAAHAASEAALRLLRPGNENYQITDAIGKISAEYGCKPIEGMLSHQLKQFRIDGEKSIIQNPSEAQRKEHEKATLETYEVYAMDVLVSTGEGVLKQFRIDGEKSIIQNPSEAQRKEHEKATLETYEVYAMDVLVSTGEGVSAAQLKQFRFDGKKSIIQNPSEAQRKEHEKATLETYEVYAMDVLVSTGEGVFRIDGEKSIIQNPSEAQRKEHEKATLETYEVYAMDVLVSTGEGVLKQFRIDGEKGIIQNPSEAQRKEHEKATLETYEVYAMDVLVSTGEGVLKQFCIDGEKSIIQNPSEAQRKEHEKATLETYEVYAMDVLVSTGEGVGREMDTRCTIYKKTDEVYQLKLKASRMFYSEVRNKHGSMPFNLRHFDKETSARLGLVECLNHKLIEPFQVLYERAGELVAQFKFTALLLPSGTHKITGLPLDKTKIKSERTIKDPELNALLNSSAKANKKKKKKAGAEEPMEVETAA
ncbi:metallopeptidase family m24 domain-containing protein [Phthorimaea operculella]|nr:metallopeptidase family m24 domain-containing protein [Phthorimaea operculella]